MHTQPNQGESLTQKEAKALKIIHLYRMAPLGPSAKLVPNLVKKGFCTEGKRSKLTPAGLAALEAYIKSSNE